MATVTVQDGEGATMEVTEWEGLYWSPEITAEYLEEVKHMEVRPDDIFVCVYAKSGTNWIREITSMLLTGKAELHGNLRQLLGDPLDFPTALFGSDRKGTARVFLTHRPFSYLPVKAREQKNKIIYVQRDIKDVAVSYYHMMMVWKPANYHGTWNGFATSLLQGDVLFGSWFDSVKSYRRLRQEDPDYPIHYMTYEDLKQNPAKEIERLSNFLELPEDKALIEGIVSKTEFSKMKNCYENSKENQSVMEMIFTTGKNEIYRKGIIGDWKNWFTVAQSEAYDAEYEKQMGHKYGEDPFF